MAGFADLSWTVDSVLDVLPDEAEAAFQRGFYLSNRGVNRIVDRFEELGNLVDAEKYVDIEDERNDDFARRERAVFEGRVAGVGEDVAAVGTSDPGTAVPGLDGGVSPHSGQGACSHACLQRRSIS